jgi:hypothetical protein
MTNVHVNPDLPPELVAEIAKFCDPITCAKACQVSGLWRYIFSEQLIMLTKNYVHSMFGDSAKLLDLISMKYDSVNWSHTKTHDGDVDLVYRLSHKNCKHKKTFPASEPSPESSDWNVIKHNIFPEFIKICDNEDMLIPSPIELAWRCNVLERTFHMIPLRICLVKNQLSNYEYLHTMLKTRAPDGRRWDSLWALGTEYIHDLRYHVCRAFQRMTCITSLDITTDSKHRHTVNTNYISDHEEIMTSYETAYSKVMTSCEILLKKETDEMIAYISARLDEYLSHRYCREACGNGRLKTFGAGYFSQNEWHNWLKDNDYATEYKIFNFINRNLYAGSLTPMKDTLKNGGIKFDGKVYDIQLFKKNVIKSVDV